MNDSRVRKLRLGVDVGGTFTDVVAIDAATRELIAKVKVPTTHGAPSGVAAGIIAGIERLLETSRVAPEDVAFIAHSTTQATNALLEGDVARVGVLGIARKRAWLARMQMRFAPVRLAPGIEFTPQFAFARPGNGSVDDTIRELASRGAEVIAASQAFGVDDPDEELRAMESARAAGLHATSGHDVSSMYGLRARTRTAALNGAILPKMLATARMTAAAVERAAIVAPLMIMRSDGGVMDVREVERRPILTMLSGPAAGVAGALLYENVTDGIFLEVGGTSVDASAIRAGQPQMRPARVGGHRTMLRTIDSRTLGIAGGSMPRAAVNALVDVGPRSAHIAGCHYASFLEAEDFEGASIERFAPTPHDPDDYIRFALRDGRFATLTPTCASNLLGYVPDDAFARGNVEAARAAFLLLAAELHAVSPEELAKRMLEIAAGKVLPLIDELIADYELPRERVVLVGGGGGAASIVPFVAQAGSFSHRIARDADVISPIGVALALVRDVVERTIVDPTPEDIVRIRQEAADRVIASGASPDRIEVSVEIDPQRNRVRATASGATAMVEAAGHGTYDVEQRRAAAAHAMGASIDAVERFACTPLLDAYVAGTDSRIVDERAVVRLALRDAVFHKTTAGALDTALRDAIESATAFGDVGRALPELYLIHGGRIADFSGLASADQAIALAREEVAGRAPNDDVVVITVARSA